MLNVPSIRFLVFQGPGLGIYTIPVLLTQIRPASVCLHQVLGRCLTLSSPRSPHSHRHLWGEGEGKAAGSGSWWWELNIATASSSLHQSLDFQSCVKYKLAAQILVYYMSNQLNKQKCQNRLNSEPVPSIYGDKAFFGEVDPLIYL